MGMLREENKASGKQTVLHVCCGPCASACVLRLKDAGREVTMLFANSNIDTAEEFERRRAAAAALAEHDGAAFEVVPYDHAEWLREVAAGFEGEPEHGARCERCFRYSLRKVAEFAAAHGIGEFTTSLTVSPHKVSSQVFAAGREAGDGFAEIDFKKGGGFQLSVARSKELNLYRQSYCGCEFSHSKQR